MPIHKIIIAPDKRLKQISTPVDKVDDELRCLIDDMLETMYAAPGIGLAAIQIGVPKQVIVMDLAREDEPPAPRNFINPQILAISKDLTVYEEGCLSAPNFYEKIARPAQCRIRFLDYRGDVCEIDCNGLLATCIQHEIDHLNGVLFIDHLSKLKRAMMLKKIIKAKKDQDKSTKLSCRSVHL
jgi:peptide deformylase